MPQAKIVKRYANRKLYDTERSCYVTLDDISMMISAGDEVKVIDNKSGEDLTSVTLAQIIFESEKKKNFMPLGLLRDLIQNRGEALHDFYRERVDKAAVSAKDLRETANARVREFSDRVGGVLRKGEETVRAPVDNLVASTQRALDDLQKGVEERVKGGVGLVGRELQQLRDRLAELEARLDADARGEHPPDSPSESPSESRSTDL